MKIGDKVIFIDQSPVMKINEIENDYATCVWLDSKDQRQEGEFHLDTLEPHVSPPDTPPRVINSKRGLF
jgi:uncharacterized protein YodC (DUF2158 family)